MRDPLEALILQLCAGVFLAVMLYYTLLAPGLN